MKSYLQKSLNSKMRITFHLLMLETWNTVVRCALSWRFQQALIHPSTITGRRNALKFLHAKINKIGFNIKFIKFTIVFLKINFCMQKFQGVLTSSDRRRMKQSLLESSWQDASNGDIFMSLALIDETLSAFYCLETFAYNFLSSDPNDVKTLRLDAPGYDESNEP